jgi:hypothetical protein
MKKTLFLDCNVLIDAMQSAPEGEAWNDTVTGRSMRAVVGGYSGERYILSTSNHVVKNVAKVLVAQGHSNRDVIEKLDYFIRVCVRSGGKYIADPRYSIESNGAGLRASSNANGGTGEEDEAVFQVASKLNAILVTRDGVFAGSARRRGMRVLESRDLDHKARRGLLVA